MQMKICVSLAKVIHSMVQEKIYDVNKNNDEKIHNDSAKWLNQGKQSTGYRFLNYCFQVHWVQE